MSSDFAISRFRHLKKLLLVHGHWCYSRLARMVVYYFYKNVVSSPAATSLPPRQTKHLSIRERVRLTWILNPATVPYQLSDLVLMESCSTLCNPMN